MKVFLLLALIFILVGSTFGADTQMVRLGDSNALVALPADANNQQASLQAAERAAKHYEEILEKTNQQLSLWFNPYGLLVSALGALFTVFAIVAAVLTWRMSKEQKDRIAAIFQEHRKMLANNQQLFDKFVAENKDVVNKLAADNKELVDKLVADTNSKLKTAQEELIGQYKAQLTSATGENKKQLEEKLKAAQETLETAVAAAKKASVSPRTMPDYVTPEISWDALSTGSFPGRELHVCSKCHYGYRIQPSLSGYSGVAMFSGIQQTITCPKCGNAESYAPKYAWP